MSGKLEKNDPKVQKHEPDVWKAVAKDLYEALDLCIAGNTNAFGRRMAALQMYQNLTQQNDPSSK